MDSRNKYFKTLIRKFIYHILWPQGPKKCVHVFYPALFGLMAN